MPTINLNDVLTQLESGLAQLAKTSLNDYVKDAQSDAQQMVNSLKDDLQNWTTELTNGDITTADLTYLVNAQKDLIEIDAFKQAGLAAIRIDQFKTSAVQLIVNTITGLIKV